MLRFYVEMYHKNKFITNADYSNLEYCARLLDDYCDKLLITDTKTNRKYTMKWGK